MASRNLDDLAPELRIKCLDTIHACKQASIDLAIICTYRSADEQDQLYAQGRTIRGPVVTNARGGQSAHNQAVNGKPASAAFDCVPIVNGKPVWSTWGSDKQLWQTIGRIGKAQGLIWAGDWKGHLVEYGHFQLASWTPPTK